MKGGQCGQRAAVDQHHHVIFRVESRVLLCASHTWLMTRRVLWLSPLLEDDKSWTGRLREAPCHVGSTCLRLLLASPDTKLPLTLTACHHTSKGPLSDGGSVSNPTKSFYGFDWPFDGRSLNISKMLTQTWT